MYHPNIAENGVIELAILKKWTVDKDMKSLFDEIKEVLENPNLDLDYLANIDASNLFLSNENQYFNTWFYYLLDGPELNDSDFDSKFNLVRQKQQEIIQQIQLYNEFNF